MEKITYLNWHDVEDLRLAKEQKGYLPDNVSNLALAGVIREAGFHVLLYFIRSGPCRKAKYAWLCYANDNEVARRMYAGFGFEEVPEAYDEVDGEMPAVLKL